MRTSGGMLQQLLLWTILNDGSKGRTIAAHYEGRESQKDGQEEGMDDSIVRVAWRWMAVGCS